MSICSFDASLKLLTDKLEILIQRRLYAQTKTYATNE